MKQPGQFKEVMEKLQNIPGSGYLGDSSGLEISRRRYDRGNRRQYDTARMCHRKPGNRSQRKNHSGKQLFDYGLLTHRPRLYCRR